VKVLHLNSASTDSGAGIAAVDLHLKLRVHGISSTMYSLSPTSKAIPDVETVDGFRRQYLRMRRLVDRKRSKLKTDAKGPFSVCNSGLKLTKKIHSYDVVHMHWVGDSFVNLSNFDSINKPKFVWTIRDLWPLTGGCHIPQSGCSQYIRICQSCPILISPKRSTGDFATNQWIQKLNFLKKNRVTLVAQSNHLAELAKSSEIAREREIKVIPGGFDDNIFKFIEKAYARKVLGLPIDKVIYSYGSTNTEDPAKGYSTVEELIRTNRNPNIMYASFGEKKINKYSATCRDFGFVADRHRLALIYAASDFYIHCSDFEAFGKTVVEAQACGTPVLCIGKSGASEILKTRTGAIIAEPYFTVRDVNEVLANTECVDRQTISGLAKRDYSMDVITSKYLSLYSSLIS